MLVARFKPSIDTAFEERHCWVRTWYLPVGSPGALRCAQSAPVGAPRIGTFEGVPAPLPPVILGAGFAAVSHFFSLSVVSFSPFAFGVAVVSFFLRLLLCRWFRRIIAL